MARINFILNRMKKNIFEESNFYRENFSHSRHYFLFRNVILKKKGSLGAPDKNFILKVAVGLSLQNASEYFTRKELKLSSYEE